MALDDYGALIQSGQQLVPDFNRQAALQAQTAALRASAQHQQAETQAEQQKQARAQMFQEDLKASDGSPQAVSRLIMKYPELADELKKGYDVQDKAARDADLTTSAEIYTAAHSGNWELAKKLAHQRADAERAAGHSDPHYDAAIESLDRAAAGDKEEQKGVLNLLGTHLAAVTGAEHFGTVYGALKGGYTLEQGAARYDDSGKMVAHSPFIKDAEGNIRQWNDSDTPGSTPTPVNVPADASPAVHEVATTLADSGLPAPVVAGFLGNFHVEGGYTGKKGDGGTSHGIMQLHSPERIANFERVIGKPVSEAAPAEQAQFAVWEMQHPEAAGMTVKQRDAILAAKTAPQAAALIDQFYERSSGEHRQKRMAAASAYASGSSPSSGGQFPILIPGKGKDAPSGYRWAADGRTLEKIPGGPADAEEEGFDPQAVEFSAQQYLATGQMPTLGMGKAAAQARKQIIERAAKIAGADGLTGTDFAQQITHYKAATQTLKTLETQAGTIEQNEKTALMNGQQFIDRSKELSAQTRFPIVNSVTQSYLRHTGDPTIAAMDAAWNTFTTEYAKVVAGSPSGAGTLSDSARHESQEIMRGNYSYQQKLSAFKQMQADMANRMAAIHQTITRKYDTLTKNPRKAAEIAAQTDLASLSAPKGGSKTIQIRSVQEYSRLPPGTHYIDPNGVARVKR